MCLSRFGLDNPINMYTIQFDSLKYPITFAVFLVAIIIILSIGFYRYCQYPTQCSDYSSHYYAQMAFEKNPLKMRHLDNDGDGVACEHLK